MAKNLKEYGEELKKMSSTMEPPKPMGKIVYPEPAKPATSTIEDHLKNINTRNKKAK